MAASSSRGPQASDRHGATPRRGSGRPSSQAPASTDADDVLAHRVLDVCDRVGAFVEYWGFKAIHGRIWTLLAVTRSPMTQSEIVDTLGVSKSLVSTAVAELASYGLVRHVDEHRNAPYEACMDIWPVVSDVLRSREWMMLESTRLALDAAIEEAEVDAGTGKKRKKALPDSRFDPDRMRLLLNMTESAQGLLRMLIAIRMPKAMTGVAGWLARASRLLTRFRNSEPADKGPAAGA